MLTERDQLLNEELTRYGHTLGLSIKHTVFSSGQSIQSEGNYAPLSMAILSDLLDKYTKEYPDPEFEKIATLVRTHTDLEMLWLDYLHAVNNFDLINVCRIAFKLSERDKVTTEELSHAGLYLVPITAGSHGVYVAFNDKFIVTSNRGAASLQEFGCQIYPLKDDAFATLQKLNLSQRKFDSMESCEVYFAKFRAPEAAAILKFKFRPQKVGNCSFANLKSLIKPLLYMNGGHDEASIIKKYKRFTSWMREYEIRQLIQKYKLAKLQMNQDFMELYQDIITAYASIAINELDRSIFKKMCDKSAEVFKRGVLSFIERDDIQVVRSNEAKLRRYGLLRLLHTELKENANFEQAFKKIPHESAKFTLPKQIINNEPVKLPARSALFVAIDPATSNALNWKQYLIWGVLFLLSPFIITGTIIYQIGTSLFGGKDNAPTTAPVASATLRSPLQPPEPVISNVSANMPSTKSFIVSKISGNKPQSDTAGASHTNNKHRWF